MRSAYKTHVTQMHIKLLRLRCKYYVLSETMAEVLRKAKKRKVETLVGEMESRKVVLFGGHGIGIANNKKQSEWLQQ